MSEDECSKQIELLTGGIYPMPAVNVISALPRHPTKKYSLRKLSDIKRIVVHTTDWVVSPYDLAKYDITPFFWVKGKKIYNHISKTGCPAITYHEMIMSDGRALSTLDWKEVSWHAGPWNKGSIAIALSYKCTKNGTDTYGPNKKMMKALLARCSVVCLKLGLNPKNIVGHRELKGTGWFPSSSGSKRLRKTCPGMKVDLDLLRRNVSIYMQIILKGKGFYAGKVDSHFGKKSMAALKAYNVAQR